MEAAQADGKSDEGHGVKTGKAQSPYAQVNLDIAYIPFAD